MPPCARHILSLHNCFHSDNLDDMALNYIWIGFFLVGFVAALAQWIFLGDTEIFKRIIDGTFDSAKMGVMDIALPLAGVMTLWLGIMNIGEKAGAVGWLAKIISPFFSRIFPGSAEGPPGHRPHGDEFLGQPAGPGQCRHALRPEGDGKPADA